MLYEEGVDCCKHELLLLAIRKATPARQSTYMPADHWSSLANVDKCVISQVARLGLSHPLRVLENKELDRAVWPEMTVLVEDPTIGLKLSDVKPTEEVMALLPSKECKMKFWDPFTFKAWLPTGYPQTGAQEVTNN